MTDQALTRLGRSVAVGSLLLGAISVVILVVGSVPLDRVAAGQFQSYTGTILVPVITLVVLPRVPRNGSIWAFAVTGAALALSLVGDALALSLGDLSSADITVSTATGADPILTAPSDLPLAAAIGLMLSMTMWIPSFVLVPTTVLLLFPDGRYPRPTHRWRWIGLVTAALLVVGIPALMWLHRPSNTMGYTEISLDDNTIFGIIGAITGTVLIPLVLASIVGYIVKWRRSTGEQRIQYRWVGFVFLTFAIWQIVTLGLGNTDLINATVLDIASWLTIAAIPIAYGVAITKYRLYDIDLVISRTLVYGLLVGMIAVVYVAIVAVPLLVLGESDGADTQPAPLLAIAATAVIAIAFQPVRRRLERLVNRLVYGKRATPYEVLSDFSQRVAATDDELLAQLPESLVDGTGAETAAVWVCNGSEWIRSTTYPADTESEPFPGFDASGNGLVSIPVEHDGEVMGAVTLQAPRAQRLTEGDERLARQVASGMGLALRNQRLTEDLHRRVDELRDSRRRIVTLQDDARRQLERDLHDGAQQQLVAVKVKLGIARQLAERDEATATASAVTTIARDADGAIDEMRTFARGIYPPLLEAEGLASALAAQARRLPITVDVSAPDLGRFDRQIESTMYFCIIEALDNVIQHGRTDHANVDLATDGDSIRFIVTDQGAGFDQTLHGGTGLTMMNDRLDVIGGNLRVQSSPGGGTTISGRLPTSTMVVA